MNGSKHTDYCVCPYCGEVNYESCQLDIDKCITKCLACGRLYEYQVNVNVDYSTYPSQEYIIKIWETEQDRDMGEPFEYLEEFNDLGIAIETAKALNSKENYACIEVLDNEETKVYYSNINSDGGEYLND